MSAKLSEQVLNCKRHTIMCQTRTVRVTDTCEMVGKFLKLHCTQQSMPNNTEGRRRQLDGGHVHRESAIFWLSFFIVAGSFPIMSAICEWKILIISVYCFISRTHSRCCRVRWMIMKVFRAKVSEEMLSGPKQWSWYFLFPIIWSLLFRASNDWISL